MNKEGMSLVTFVPSLNLKLKKIYISFVNYETI